MRMQPELQPSPPPPSPPPPRLRRTSAAVRTTTSTTRPHRPTSAAVTTAVPASPPPPSPPPQLPPPPSPSPPSPQGVASTSPCHLHHHRPHHRLLHVRRLHRVTALFSASAVTSARPPSPPRGPCPGRRRKRRIHNIAPLAVEDLEINSRSLSLHVDSVERFANWTPARLSRSEIGGARRTGRMAGWQPSRSHRMNESSQMGSLLSGSEYTPVLNGDSRANRSRAPLVADHRQALAAGAGRMEQTISRCRQELEGERKMRGPAMSITNQYDAYLDASEEHAFGKLRATLGKLERKAEREHEMYAGAAGWTTEHRNELAEARSSPGGRRARSPARFGHRDQGRGAGMGGGSDSSAVASLLSQGDYINGLEQRAPSYRERAPSPRAPSPMRRHPAVPPIFGDHSQEEAYMPSGRRAASPRAQRAPSPMRQRQGA